MYNKVLKLEMNSVDYDLIFDIIKSIYTPIRDKNKTCLNDDLTCDNIFERVNTIVIAPTNKTSFDNRIIPK